MLDHFKPVDVFFAKEIQSEEAYSMIGLHKELYVISLAYGGELVYLFITANDLICL